MAQFTELRIKHQFRTELHNVHVADLHGNSPLHTAVLEGNLPILISVIEYGASVNATNKNIETALHLATKKNNFEIMKILLRAGANPNAQDADQCTPLHHFLKYYDNIKWREQAHNRQKIMAMVNLMLESGAQSNMGNVDGTTLVHLAIESQQPDLVEMIMEDARDRDVTEDRLRAKCLLFGFGILTIGFGCLAIFTSSNLNLIRGISIPSAISMPKH